MFVCDFDMFVCFSCVHDFDVFMCDFVVFVNLICLSFLYVILIGLCLHLWF